MIKEGDKMKRKNNLLIGLTILFIIIVGILLINNINNKPGELLKIIVSRSNCSHCISYKPKMEQIAKDYKITIYYIDYDEDPQKDDLLNKFNLDGSTPMTLFIKDGKETSVLKRLEGDLDKDKVIEKLKEMEFIK